MTRKVPDAVDSYKKVLFLLAGIIVVVVGIFFTMSQFKEKAAQEALRAAKPTTDVRFTEELTVYSGMDSRWIEEILIGYCIKVVGDKALIVTMGDRNVAEYDPLLKPDLPKEIITPLRFKPKYGGPVRFRVYYAPVQRTDGNRRNCSLFNPRLELREYYEALQIHTKSLQP
ncbi:MAG TPA: hypothetical protein VJB70_04925 [Candidatus Paceibacterota bacterium]